MLRVRPKQDSGGRGFAGASGLNGGLLARDRLDAEADVLVEVAEEQRLVDRVELEHVVQAAGEDLLVHGGGVDLLVRPVQLRKGAGDDDPRPVRNADRAAGIGGIHQPDVVVLAQRARDQRVADLGRPVGHVFGTIDAHGKDSSAGKSDSPTYRATLSEPGPKYNVR